MILQRGSAVLVMNHLRPFTTHSLPSRLIEVRMLVASDEATSGSVMAKAERIFPSSSGFSHCSFCPGEAARWSSSMLPVSGAEQLKTSDDQWMRPMISAQG